MIPSKKEEGPPKMPIKRPLSHSPISSTRNSDSENQEPISKRPNIELEDDPYHSDEGEEEEELDDCSTQQTEDENEGWISVGSYSTFTGESDYEDDEDEDGDERINRQPVDEDEDGDEWINRQPVDEDERYARLLQQQEIALAGSHVEMGIFLEAEDESEFDMSYESLIQLEENLGEVKKRGLDLYSIKALPRIPFERSMIGCEDSSHICVICMTEFIVEETLMRLPCKHYFHDECAFGWLQLRASCPICRKAIIEPPITID